MLPVCVKCGYPREDIAHEMFLKCTHLHTFRKEGYPLYNATILVHHPFTTQEWALEGIEYTDVIISIS